VFDEVAAGNSQAYIAADYYWIGKHPAFAYFTSVPFGMTTPEWNAWIKFGGGQALWDELSGSNSASRPCPAARPAPRCRRLVQQGDQLARRPQGPEDAYSRAWAAGDDQAGRSTVSLPGGQIYENLVSGAVEATEWVGPYNDYFMKFYEAAKFYYTGGMHEPGGGLAFGMNKSFWEGLSEIEKAIITAACNEEHAASTKSHGQ
jgi:TRAP-type mannitol/chloroaromatic compound transport system substrate-binding protein